MINIEILTTSFRIICSRNGKLGDDGSFNIKPYVDFNLSEYEFDRFGHRVLKYRYVVYEDGYLYFPRFFLDDIRKLLNKYNRGHEVVYFPSNKYTRINTKLAKGLKDREKQSEVIDYVSNTKDHMCCLDLQTSFGKTYVAIKSAVLLKKTFLVLVPTHLIDQWELRILSMTDLTKDDIYILRGKESISKLCNENLNTQYKCYIGSLPTLYNYIKNSNDSNEKVPKFSELIRKLNIGNKIIDEVHLNFHMMIFIDLLCNIDTNIYLSGTYVRGSKQSNVIFQRTFPREIRFSFDSYNKYTNITEYNYSIGYINKRSVMTARGYSQIKYEQYLMSRRTKFDAIYEIISSIFYNKYIKLKTSNDKCLILVKMKKFAKILASKLSEEYKTDKLYIGEYLYETPNEQLDNLDVIISTVGSCGVGKDIKDLRTVIVFDSFKSESGIYQTLGRLRELKDRVPEYTFMQNIDISSHLYHRKIRRNILRHLTNNYQIISK
jgi:superfamily II DNA or RNA helicase